MRIFFNITKLAVSYFPLYICNHFGKLSPWKRIMLAWREWDEVEERNHPFVWSYGTLAVTSSRW